MRLSGAADSSSRNLSTDLQKLSTLQQQQQHDADQQLASSRLQLPTAAARQLQQQQQQLPTHQQSPQRPPPLPTVPQQPAVPSLPPAAHRDDFFDVPPPLPPKPKQKISVIGSPNSDQFIVIDNSSFFSSGAQDGGHPGEDVSTLSSPSTFSASAACAAPYEPEAVLSSPASLVQEMLTEAPGLAMVTPLHLRGTPDPHSRSDSGLSSMSSWTTAGGSCGARSGCSSVRSSSIVSNSSTKLEELLEEQQRRTASGPAGGGGVVSCSLRLVEELAEQQEETAEGEQQEEQAQLRSAVSKIYFQAPRGWTNSCKSADAPAAAAAACVQQPDEANDADYDDASSGPGQLLQQQTSKATGVQRQLSTIRQQKERLIRDIVENERVGRHLTAVAAERLSGRDLNRLTVFLAELEKVVLLLLSLGSRLQRAEAELLGCGNLTDWDKESIR
jgi:hypothetical protein